MNFLVDEEITFPARAIKKNLAVIPIKLNRSELTNFCRAKQSYIFFHLPSEIPTLFHETFPVTLDKLMAYRIVAESHQTDEALRGYSPQKRDCYFEGERQLRFFKTYTKAHCYWECMTNYTLELCGCVKVSMPRDNKTRICSLDEAFCFLNAMDRWPNNSANSNIEKPCDCMPSCHDIKYKISPIINSPLEATYAKVYTNFLGFKVHGYVAEVHETILAYKLINFV